MNVPRLPSKPPTAPAQEAGTWLVELWLSPQSKAERCLGSWRDCCLQKLNRCKMQNYELQARHTRDLLETVFYGFLPIPRCRIRCRCSSPLEVLSWGSTLLACLDDHFENGFSYGLSRSLDKVWQLFSFQPRQPMPLRRSSRNGGETLSARSRNEVGIKL